MRIWQVLDDSTDEKTRELVDDKCLEWQERGVDCVCVRRTNRQGLQGRRAQGGGSQQAACSVLSSSGSTVHVPFHAQPCSNGGA